MKGTRIKNQKLKQPIVFIALTAASPLITWPLVNAEFLTDKAASAINFGVCGIAVGLSLLMLEKNKAEDSNNQDSEAHKETGKGK